jgi:hypothetical protein
MKVNIEKSSRHSKITGDFAEAFILYFLSKHGFECANIDHIGIDIIAKNRITRELIGISVKSRSRTEGKEKDYISIPNDNLLKINRACRAFNCIPYFAFVVDLKNKMRVFIISKRHLLKLFPKGKSVISWKMSEYWLAFYDQDEKIIKIDFDYNILTWWKRGKHYT